MTDTYKPSDSANHSDLMTDLSMVFIGGTFDGPRGQSLLESFTAATTQNFPSYAVSASFEADLTSAIEELLDVSAGEGPTKKTIYVTSSNFLKAFVDQFLFNTADETSAVSRLTDENLEHVARVLHSSSSTILLLAAADHASLASEAMSVGRALGIAVDSALDSTPDELIVEKLQSLLAISVQRSEMTEQKLLVEETNNHLIREQEVAKAVFEKVTSEHSIDLPCVRQWLSPIAVFNGDVFMAAPTPNHNLLVLLGDFTGHGLGAALGAIPLASTFYRMAGKGFALKEIVIEINKRLHDSLPTGFFCCGLIAKIDFENQSVEYLNAGLPDCYWLKNKNGEVQPLVSSALPLGILSPAQFDVDLQRLSIAKGDRLFMLSDGLLETENAFGEAFGTHRIIKAINGEYLKITESGHSPDFMSGVKTSVKEFLGANQRFDDISFAEIEIVEFSEFKNSYDAKIVSESQEPADWSISYRFGASSLKNKDPVPQVLNLLLEEPGLREHAGTVFSIVSELYNNALDHGVLELESSLKNDPAGFAHFYEQRSGRLDRLETGQISFDISYEACAETGCLNITIEDTGAGFDWYNVNKAMLAENAVDETSNIARSTAMHGRGIPLLQQLCDHLSYSGRGNIVKAVFSWDQSDRQEDPISQRKIA